MDFYGRLHLFVAWESSSPQLNWQSRIFCRFCYSQGMSVWEQFGHAAFWSGKGQNGDFRRGFWQNDLSGWYKGLTVDSLYVRIFWVVLFVKDFDGYYCSFGHNSVFFQKFGAITGLGRVTGWCTWRRLVCWDAAKRVFEFLVISFLCFCFFRGLLW